MISVTKIVKQTLKKYGKDAAGHFGLSEGTLKSYTKRGRYPLALVDKIMAEVMSSGAGTIDSDHHTAEPTTGAPSEVGTRAAPEATSASRLAVIEDYLQRTVDFYLRQFNDRITAVEQKVELLRVEHLRQAGMPSLARPAQGVPAEQTFTTRPENAGVPGLGVAPTKEMVDAQANMTIIEGVPVRGAQLAGPAEPANSPPFGYGWNQPRPPK